MLAGCAHRVGAREAHWERLPDLPVPRANNAIAVDGAGRVVSALGLAPGRRWNDVVSDAWIFESSAGAWSRLADVPGPGRLASTAVGVCDEVWLIGGYTVAEDGTEVSVPGVDVWTGGEWSSGPTMPTPVDDAVAALWRDRWLVLVSGWSNDDNVAAVQLYDTQRETWHEGTDIVGAPVFGHAGALVGDTLVYCGGVRVVPATDGGRRSFAANPGCYQGVFADSVGEVAWTRLPPRAGDARYRMASGPIGNLVVFAGGTDNPYNYDGVGYDGRPAEPVDDVFAWDVAADQWIDLPPLPEPSMDHRGLVPVGGGLVLVGGLDAAREPTAKVWRLVLH